MEIQLEYINMMEKFKFKPKILYIDLNIYYVNPTRNLIPLLLKLIGDTDIYGLGYLSDNTIKQGIDIFIKKKKKNYDFIITNEHIIFPIKKLNLNKNKLLNAYKRNYFFQFDLNLLENFLTDTYTFFKDINARKIVFLLESDYYNFSDEQINELEQKEIFIVGLNKQFYSSKEELKFLKFESFYKNVNNNWFNFINRYDNRIISLFHFVGLNEFYFDNLLTRKSIVRIPGANYFLRKKVKEVLRKKILFPNKDKLHNYIYLILNKLGFRPFGRINLLDIYRNLFTNQLRKSKYAYTCGSGLNWPLRKFFEIPACGTLLLATPFKNANHMGFIDGENFIKCDYTNIVEKIEFLEKNPELAEKIAKKGQELVWKKHSILSRVEQFKNVLYHIKYDRFNGSYWKDGEFYIKTKYEG